MQFASAIMSSNTQARVPLVMENDPEPTYNWFGDLDYSWFDNSGSLTSVPFFEVVPDQLAQMLETSSARRPLRLTFGPDDCATASMSRNCTEACSNPSTLFAPANLRACTALAGAALLVQNETYSVDRSDALTSEVMNTWHIPELSAYNATAVLRHVAECISESCAVGSKLGECPNNLQTLSDIHINADNLEEFSSRLERYCNGVTVEINSDIAGPGASLAFLLYLLMRSSTTWAGRVDTLFRKRRSKQHSKSPGAKEETFLSKLAASSLGAAATSSLVEFQEMQLYFVASVQIATLVSYNRSTTESTGTNNASYAAMLLNSGLAALLATSSMACVLLVQCCLQRARMHWWYTFVLMTYTYVFALVIFARRSRLMPPADGLWEKFKADGLLDKCGNNPSPMTYCKPPQDTKFLDNAAAGYAVCCLGAVAWVGFFIDQLASSIPKKFPTAAHRLANFKPKITIPGSSRFWTSLSVAYWISLEVLLVIMAGYHFSQLVLVVMDVDIGNASRWGFGQLIAISLWAPTIAKFIYSNIFGIKGGFEPRIDKSFKIMKDGEAEGAPATC
ncbi:integral membrane protein [Purpureocillium lavendulum]|uniref:Integral membrane protein n=1 Tax=Purpureocillium lavendulum TaxID=1247861 RepID=A0AB34FTN1_9HYPO|nr:integral membrane protein [Purpureocillium lavendulum]